jgi:hypothetical protein
MPGPDDCPTVKNAYPDHIRVALVGLSGIVADIVRGALAAADDIEVHGELSVVTDVAILDLDSSALIDSPAGLLTDHPLLKVVTVSSNGRVASLYEMRPHRTDLGEVSPQTLVDAVRMAAA